MKRILSMFLALCMGVTFLPMTALAAPDTTVTVGGVKMTYEGTPIYAVTDVSGVVTTEGATEDNYNVKLEEETLTLRNATITGTDIVADYLNCGIYIASDDLFIVLEGDNTVRGSVAEYSTYGICAEGNLTISGSGNLAVDGGETISGNSFGIAAMYNLTISLSGSLTATGGNTSSDSPGYSYALYAHYIVTINSGTVVAVGGTTSNVKYTGSYGICTATANHTGKIIVNDGAVTAMGGKAAESHGLCAYNMNSILVKGGAVTAVGGEGEASSYGAFSNGGSITVIGGKLVAVGGKSSTESYGICAKNNGSSVATITYDGGLLVAKGGKATTSLALNKAPTGDALTSAAVTSSGDASKYYIVSPKSGETADYHVVEGTVSSSSKNETTGHITWDVNNITLNNTVIIGSPSALAMKPGATLTQTGFNVLLGGDGSTSYGVTYEGAGSTDGITITGVGALVTLGGAAIDTTAGIRGVSNITATGSITAIGGSSEISSSYGIFADTAIESGRGVAIGGTPGEGGNAWAFSKNPTTGLATTGAWSGKVMTWGPALLLPSTTPATDTPTVAKTSAAQASVSFTMTTAPAGEYKVYADDETESEHDKVTASISGDTLTLTHESDIPTGTYYISVTEDDKPESRRLALTVLAYDPAPTTCHLTVNLNGGNGGTTDGDYAPGTEISINAGTKAGYTFSGWTATLGDNFADASSPSTTFTMPPNNTSITANWNYSGGGGGGSSSDDDNNSSVIVTPPAADKPNSPTQGEIKFTGTADGKGNITVSITGKTVTDAFNKALANAKKNGNEQNGITVILRVDTGSKTASNVTVNLPKTVQDTIIEKKIVSTVVVIDNPDIRIGMDLATVMEINKQAKSDVNITATRADSGKLIGEAKKAIGSRPVFDLSVNYGSGKQVQSFGEGSVSVTIPYTLGANEKAENVQAVYVDVNGNVHWLVSSIYDSVEKVLRFSTNHFSTYGIGYKQINTLFTDIASHWAKEDIEFVVRRGLFSGTSTTTFSPNTAMTRAMFVTALGRLANADVSGYAKSSFSDVKNDAYYMGYIEWASKNNIVDGVGNNQFAPDQYITREQMAVVMQNYAKVIGFILPKAHTENIFADNAKISAYAKDAVKQMQMAGAISGRNGNLFDPQGTATRAEVSAVFRRFVELAISSNTMQGWTMNDSGKWMYFKNGNPVTGKNNIDGSTYTFDQYGMTADIPKNLRYTTYIVQKGDSLWLIANNQGCTMSELERLNNKSRFDLIHQGDVLRVPEK